MVESLKLLGVIIQCDLKWDKQVNECVSKASKRLFTLSVLRKALAPANDLLTVFTTYIRPVLEYVCTLWHSSLTNIQCTRIERVQKRALRSIYGANYISYENALSMSGLCSLESRRDNLMMKFGNGLLLSKLYRDMLPPYRNHGRNLRNINLLDAPLCKTNRWKRSTIPIIIDRMNEASKTKTL